jgi:hypothetical protein
LTFLDAEVGVLATPEVARQAQTGAVLVAPHRARQAVSPEAGVQVLVDLAVMVMFMWSIENEICKNN